MSPEYANFDLLVDRSESGYKARVTESPAGQATAAVTISAAVAEIQAAVAQGWAATDLEQATVKEWGTALYAALFPGEVETCLRRSLDAAERAGRGLRIRLRLADVPELATLPWEFVYAPALSRFLALSRQSPLVRYMELGEAQPSLLVDPPLAVLCVLSDPTDLSPRLEVENEWRSIQDALAPLVAAGRVTLERLPAPTLTALQAHLRRKNVHVLHFIGHGWFDGAGAQSGLVFENEQQQALLITEEQLGVLLDDHAALRLVFLSACEGARVDERDAFQGTAQYLVRLGVPAVLAMQFVISAARAGILSREFYRALADGYAAEAAVTEARKALFDPAGAPEWMTPVLFTRADDTRLVVPVSTPDAPPVIETPPLPFEPETVAVPAGPFVMGSSDASPEWRQHTVELDAFHMGKYPVTNEQYAAFVREHRDNRPRQSGWFFTTPPAGQLDHPVTGITWHDAAAYCEWLSAQTGRHYRLPTEAEWEKAARSADARSYPWGDAEPDASRCNMGTGRTSVVTAHPDGSSPYGCCDMAGNVREWTLTLWGDNLRQARYTYPYRHDGREGAGERPNDLRICRGGAYDDPAALYQCSARTIVHSDARLPTVGFRVVLAR